MSGWPLAAVCGVLAAASALLLWVLVRCLRARIDAKTDRG